MPWFKIFSVKITGEAESTVTVIVDIWLLFNVTVAKRYLPL